MKKSIRILLCFLMLAVLLVSCDHGTNNSVFVGANISPLFDVSEATDTINSLSASNLSDGNWKFKSVHGDTYSQAQNRTIGVDGSDSYEHCDVSSYKLAVIQEFSISNGTVSNITGTKTFEWTMDDANKTKLNNFAASKGVTLNWNGNTVAIVTNLTTNEYLGYMFTDSSNTTWYEAKKNSTGTKFVVKHRYETNTYHDAHYLMKK